MEFVDCHNHLMPGVDDGAQTRADSINALREFMKDGVSVIVTTPHVDGRITKRPAELAARLGELDRAFEVLSECAEAVGNVRVERGAEVMLDVPDPDVSDGRLRLAGTQFFLMEFPFMTVPPHSDRAIAKLTKSGYTPVIAHPERYRGMSNDHALARLWKENGALLQVNGGSLLGLYGDEARARAFQLLEYGLVDYLGSDYHARGPARVAQYAALLQSAGADELAHTLMATNPARLVQGLAPLPVSSLRGKQNLWGRVTAIFR